MLGLNRYQWTVLFAAWLGWGFDVFDGLLFNYVAPNCVPTLLGLPIGSPEAKAATLYWTGLLTSMLLLGWAAGRHPVRLGLRPHRAHAHADADDAAVRAGHGGLRRRAQHLDAAGVPHRRQPRHRRRMGGGRLDGRRGGAGEAARRGRRAAVHRGADGPVPRDLRQPSQVAGVWFAGQPRVSWRYVFLFGLVPAAAAFIVRLFVQRARALAGR